jgi:hypothetical protein
VAFALSASANVSDAVQVCVHEIERPAKAAEWHDDFDAMREIAGKRLFALAYLMTRRFLSFPPFE